MRSRFKNILVILAGLSAFLLSAVSLAQGGPGWGMPVTPVADNKNHIVCWNHPSLIIPQIPSAINAFNSGYSGATGVVMTITSCAPYIDIKYQLDTSLGANVGGQWQCDIVGYDAVDGWLCLEGTAKLNLPAIANNVPAWFTLSQATVHIICHETGHSYGFWDNYDTNSCMPQGFSVQYPTQYSAMQLVYLSQLSTTP